MLKTRAFYAICIVKILLVMSMLVNAFTKFFGETFINDDYFLTVVGSISTFTNCITRLGWGLVIDRFGFKFSLVMMTGLLSLVECTIYLTKFIGNKFIYLIWIIFYNSLVSGNYVILPTGVAKTFGEKHYMSITIPFAIADVKMNYL
jgi:MFS family permease